MFTNFNKIKYYQIVIFVVVFQHCFGAISTIDSITVQKRGILFFILHQVEDSETLYSLSNRYKKPIYDIIEHNSGLDFKLNIGDTILVPYEEKKLKNTNDYSISDENKLLKNKHIVEQGQSIYYISQLYGITVEQLKKYNGLETNHLNIGQILIIKPTSQPHLAKELSDDFHVIMQGQTLYSISKMYGVSIEDLKKINELTSNDLFIGQKLIIKKSSLSSNNEEIISREQNKPVDELISNQGNNELADSSDLTTLEYQNILNEVIEKGLAERISKNSKSDKFLALHKTAQPGVIIKVINEMNDKTVFVRVIGKLPDTGVNKNVVLKISSRAYDELEAVDEQFRVIISYIP